ncbi:MAG: general secretion pathway protein GspK [Prosthecobacter sp.]|uniref:general secretion pathway protein GspK n=1 Tax=Prosthecobacter sp. TaxID=1965333 RepID=UPI002637174C|nr:type II secretion system protein GspK [Prosthecobacter sp.]MCF7789388.1 general secretion pathway protein GspK [Prosthecobacter sp.]
MKCASQSHKQAAATGSVLLAVLCLLAVLSFLIITTAAMSREHGEMQQARTTMMRARQLAESGIAVASHPQLKAGDPLLQSQVSGIESYETTLTTEERLLNLNSLLTAERLPLLERIFMSWGLSLADAQDIAATLMDWTDADDLKRRPGSAEKLDYQHEGLPPNHPFASLDELDLVARVEELNAAKPDWRTWFTLRGNGQLDVNTASAEILAAVTGASMENAELLVSTRTGPKGAPIQSLEEAAAILGIAGSDTNFMTLSGPTRHVESIGRAGDARCGIALILDLKDGTPRMVEWREFSVKGAELP